VYSKNAETLAAISFAPSAGDANAAVDVRINRTEITGFDASFVTSNLNHHACQFVSEYTGIGIGGMTAS
jgi:hypothetical protein